MATLHIRNVPDEVVETLKQQAQLAGRSLNAEVVRILGDGARRPRRSIDEVIESVRRRAERINLPPEAVQDAVEGMRRDRDERAAHIERLTNRTEP